MSSYRIVRNWGGLPVSHMETVDFAQCINNCALSELSFSGSLYTWWNGRTEIDSIFKRLDRVFGNEVFWQEYNMSEVKHLIRDGSDHAPLHVACTLGQNNVRKPFRFLNFWISHQSFTAEVQRAWEVIVEGSPSRYFRRN